MPREVYLAKWCDVCWRRQPPGDPGPGRRQEAVHSYELTIDDRALALDLCEEHSDPTLSVVMDVAQPVITGQTPSSRQTSKALPCPVPMCPITAANKHGLMVHISRTHQEITQEQRRAMLSELPGRAGRGSASW